MSSPAATPVPNHARNRTFAGLVKTAKAALAASAPICSRTKDAQVYAQFRTAMPDFSLALQPAGFNAYEVNEMTRMFDGMSRTLGGVDLGEHKPAWIDPRGSRTASNATYLPVGICILLELARRVEVEGYTPTVYVFRGEGTEEPEDDEESWHFETRDVTEDAPPVAAAVASASVETPEDKDAEIRRLRAVIESMRSGGGDSAERFRAALQASVADPRPPRPTVDWRSLKNSAATRALMAEVARARANP